MVSLPMLKSFEVEVKNAYTILTSSIFPEDVQPKIASIYLDSLGLILIF